MKSQREINKNSNSKFTNYSKIVILRDKSSFFKISWKNNFINIIAVLGIIAVLIFFYLISELYSKIKLRHQNILKIKFKDIIEKKFVIKNLNYTLTIIEKKIIFNKNSYLYKIKNKIYINSLILLEVNDKNKVLKKIKKTKIFKKIRYFLTEDKILRINRQQKYLDLAINELFLYNKTYNKSNDPKISIIIPCYNCKKSIKKTIVSIKNQKFKEFEIIITNDNSLDNSSQLLDELQINDKRIKIITNERNRGTLYSRSNGVLNSKGKYLMFLDSDDLYIEENLIYILYNYIDTYQIDFIKFAGYMGENFTLNSETQDVDFNHKLLNFSLFQPELSHYLYKIDNDKLIMQDANLWSKIHRRQLFIKILNLFTENIYNQYLVIAEDLIMSYYIYKYAKSFTYLRFYGHYYLKWKGSVTHTLSNVINAYSNFIQLKIQYNFPFKTDYDIKVIVNFLLYYCKRIITYKNNITEIKNNFDNFYVQLMDNKKISRKTKIKIEKACVNKYMLIY